VGSLITRKGFIRAIAAVIVLLAGTYNMAGGITSKADIYYVHWAGYLTFEPERAMVAFRDSKSAAPGFEAVYRSRQQSASNYLVVTVASYLGAKIFPGELVRPVVFAHALAMALVVLVFYFAMGPAGSMIPAMGLVIVFYAVQGLLSGPHPTDHLLFYGGLKNILNLVALVLAPGEAFNILSFWPKSNVLFLGAVVLCLRSDGELHKGYGVLLISVLFHVTLSVVFFLGFLVMDVALRRTQLSWKILLPMLAISAGMFLRSQWQVFADTGHGPMLLSALGLIILAAFATHSRIAPLFARVDILSADILLILCAAVVAVPASMAIFVMFAPDNLWAPVSVYLQLATRLLVFAVVALSLWCARFAAAWLKEREAMAAEGIILLIVCGMTAYASAGAWWWQSKTIHARLHDPIRYAPTEKYALPYYLSLKKLAAGSKGFTDAPPGTSGKKSQ
jgi:hypothetical protein